MDIAHDELSFEKNRLAKDIVGEIVLSDNPERIIKKWRTIFKISQKQLASELGITSSVISDYESGRRSSPGIRVIKKYVNALLEIDRKCGSRVVGTICKSAPVRAFSDAVIDIKEFSSGVGVGEFCRAISAPLVAGGGDEREIYGYTVIDSLKAITEASFSDLIKFYGKTTQRALIFTKVSTGRSPLVAIKVSNMYPSLIVLHGLDVVDEVAKRISDVEKIPLAVCRLDSVETIKERLKKMG